MRSCRCKRKKEGMKEGKNERKKGQESLSPPEKTFLLVLSKARQKMLDRCSPFSFTGLDRPWRACSMCHSRTRRSSPPDRKHKQVTDETAERSRGEEICRGPGRKSLWLSDQWNVRNYNVNSSVVWGWYNFIHQLKLRIGLPELLIIRECDKRVIPRTVQALHKRPWTCWHELAFWIYPVRKHRAAPIVQSKHSNGARRCCLARPDIVQQQTNNTFL